MARFRVVFAVYLIVWVLLAITLVAQTHPCDGTPVANPSVSGAVKVGFCWDGKDTAGNSTTAASMAVQIDGTQRFTGLLTPAGPANAAGLQYYETPALTVSRGSHAVTATITNAEGVSVLSVPFTFAAVGAPPAAAMKLRVAGS